MFSELTFKSINAASALPEISESALAMIVLGGLGIGLLIELLASRGKVDMKLRGWSYLVNLGTFFSNNIVMSLLSMSTLLLIAERYSQFGVLSTVDNPFTKLILSFILLDLTLYLWHRACHTSDRLWVFHKVHHSDPLVNISTSFRLHITEVLLTTVIKGVFVVAIGVDLSTLILSETLITLFILFHHWDLNLPGQKWLSRVIITPTLHRVHHSQDRAEHDNNYGAVLSIWDRLFASYKESCPVAIGLFGVTQQGWFALLKYGFTPELSPTVIAPRRHIPVRVPM
jgi:sterol desaturase/sphingolipid hydroxylase (fatty acid hydroxylase superfamily)